MWTNRFYAQTKRFFAHPLYAGMLALIVLMTTVYVLLPAKEQSAAIRVGIYNKDSSDLSQKAVHNLLKDESLYTFYESPSEDDLKYDITSGYSECGYVIPEGFFDSYIQGVYDNPVLLYDMPKSTLTLPINERFFSSIFTTCAPYVADIVVAPYGISDEYGRIYEEYAGSDKVFRLEPVTKGSYRFESGMYKLDVPVAQTVIVLLVLSGLIAQFMFLKDRESGKYTTLKKGEIISLSFIMSIAAILPVLLTGTAACLIMYGMGMKLMLVILTGIAMVFFSVLSSMILKKSTLFVRVLPIIVLISIVLSFMLTLAA